MNKPSVQYDYAAKTEELEGILAHLQAEDVPIDQALPLHAAGKALIAELETYLMHAEVAVKRQLAKDA